MADRSDPTAGPVALVIQRRIVDEGYAAFTRWNGKVTERLKVWPGFLGQEVVPPQPPVHDDWVLILHFTNPASARSWLESDERAALVEEIRPYFVGPEDVHILPGTSINQEGAVSAVISFMVPAGQEDAFLAWQHRIQAAEAICPGFLRHKIEKPISGLHDDWIVILSFDNDANLTAWLESPLRQTLLAEGEAFNASMSVKRASYGFNFWFPGNPAPETLPAASIFKCNLIVLMVLYPVVFLWGYFIGRPFLDANGAPFWLALFIGNLVSTQFLGWWAVPVVSRAFSWWLSPKPGFIREVAGYGVVTALCAISMAVCAFLFS